MKSIVLSGVVASLLFFSGCSDKSPAVDEMAQVPTQEVKAVETETVSSENSVVNATSEDIAVSDSSSSESVSNNTDSQLSMSDIESTLTTVYFDFDKFNIKPEMKSNISTDAKIVTSSASAYNIKLEGNCDEWGSDEYNFALGLKRADSVKKSLTAEGVDASRIVMVSYGESNPACNDKTQECWSKNRRVDFSLLP